MTIRPAAESDIPAIARVHVDTWRAAYAGIVDAAHLASLSYESFEKRRRERFVTPGTKTFVAEADGAVFGFAVAGPIRELHGAYDAELYAIYVRPGAARHGAGKRLLAASAAWLAEEKRRSMLVWVLRDNRAGRSFYEKFGGVLDGTTLGKIGAQELEEVAYGWPDVASLAARLST